VGRGEESTGNTQGLADPQDKQKSLQEKIMEEGRGVKGGVCAKTVEKRGEPGGGKRPSGR